MSITIRPATQDDHKRLTEIAKTHRAGQGFTHFMFSGPDAYKKGWIRVAYDPAVPGPNGILGFTCVRHKVRVPKTMLYYIIVDSGHARKGIGQLLLEDLKNSSPHDTLELSCLKDNAPALAFYEKNGFEIRGESLKGKGHHLEKIW